MKKFLAIIMLAIAPMMFVACDDEPHREYDPGYPYDPNWPWNGGGQTQDPFNQSLTSQEQGMVGSYVSADGKAPIVFVLNNDRSGYYVATATGNKFQFKWAVQNSTLYLKGTSTNKNETYSVMTSTGGYLYLNNIPFVNPFTKSMTSDEAELVNTWMSDDGQEPFYMFFNKDRSGGITVNGSTTSFTWFMRNSILYTIYSNTEVTLYKASYSNQRLTLTSSDGTVVPFKVYKKQEETKSPLVNQWQGAMNASFYKDVYGLSGTQYATIYEFAADGKGAQLDYDERSPKDNFSYIQFTWVINGESISIRYADSGTKLKNATADNYILTNDKFSGQMSLTGFANSYSFAFTKTSGFDWTPFLPVNNQTRNAQAVSLLTQLRNQQAKSLRKGSFK